MKPLRLPNKRLLPMAHAPSRFALGCVPAAEPHIVSQTRAAPATLPLLLACQMAHTSPEHFATLVRQYLSCIQAADDQMPHALLSRCARLLPEIYAAGLDLADADPDDSEESERYRDMQVPSPMGRLAARLGRCSLYHEVFDPVFETEAIGASLADDLADIYVDLARSLAAFEAGHVDEAVWHWKSDIVGHSGDHLVDALRTIHRLVNDHMPSDFRP